MSTQTAPTLALEVKRVIKAPRERVFEAWTKPELVRQWLGGKCSDSQGMQSATIDLRAGGQYVYNMATKQGDFPIHGVYREVNPPKQLVFTWNADGSCAGAPGIAETLVTVDFAEVTGGTEVRIKHERFTSGESRDRHNDGWTTSLEYLEKVVAGEKTR